MDGKGKAGKQQPDKDANKKASKASAKKGKAKDHSAGSRKIDEFFQPGDTDSSHEDEPGTGQKKVSTRKHAEKHDLRDTTPPRDTQKPEPKKLSPRRKIGEQSKPKSAGKTGGRMSTRRKNDDVDDESKASSKRCHRS